MANVSNKTPHVHAECIKAWADGAMIQYYDKHKVSWVDVPDNCPTWYFGEKYRVKPEPTPDVFRYAVATRYKVEYMGPYNGRQDNNIMFVFDGETGVLKDAQVLAHV
jgi:hypothetical protein